MNDYAYAVGAMKERLLRFRDMEREIDNQIERLERMESKMTAVGAQVLSDMPRSPSVSNDRMAGYVAQKELLENNIRNAIARQAEEKKAIEGMILQLKSSDERAVIRMRYFDRESWDAVCDMLFGGMEDYLGKEESYLRRVHKLHHAALVNMVVIEAKTDQRIAIPDRTAT